MTPGEFHSIGQAFARKEDFRLLTGQGRFVDDVQVPGALHACFVRSPHAHARLLGIDTSVALEMPGVVAVFTGKDVAQWATRARMAPPIEGLQAMEMDVLPIDKVRFQGDPVACVIARDRYLAEDAAEQVSVDYEPLPVVTSMWQALQPDAPLVDDGLTSNLLSHQQATFGDPQARAQEAHRVIERRFSMHRQTHLPIETRGCAAVWDAGREHLTLHVGTQVPHPLRTTLAGRLRLSESQVTIVSQDVGGGFGQKIALYREELTVAAVARQLKQPVRWREDRMENLLASSQAREDDCLVRAAVDEQGRLLGLELEILEDFGAYSFFPGNYLARVVALILTGPYKVQDYRYDVKVVLSNKVGNGPMRAPMAITSWLMDGTLDAVARELGLDPLAVRQRNMLRPNDYPYRMATGEVLEDITPHQTLAAAVAAIGYQDFRRRQQEALSQGRYLGLGICTVVESTTYGSRFYKAAGIPGSGHEAAWVRIEPTGVVNASVGLGPTGQGYETSMSHAVAEGLGVPVSQVRILLGHTDIAPYGMGSRGARGGTAGGGTLLLCAREAQDKVLAIARHHLNLPSEVALRMVAARVQVRREGVWEDTGLTLVDVARKAYLDPTSLPEGVSPGLEFHKTYDPPPMTYSNSSHVCEVEIDAETGAIRLGRYIVAEDCGTVLSPVVVEGQQLGAIAMGLSGTLFEHIEYDELGQNLSGTLADYLVATAHELPTVEILSMHTPNRSTPAGLKGMAEGGVMGAIGAVSNAVGDALAPLGVAVDRLPLTPVYLRGLIRQATQPIKE